MSQSTIQDGDRFEELQPTGDAGALWQVVSADDGEDRVHLFDVDDPTHMRTVQRERLLEGHGYRKVAGPPDSAPEAA